MATPTYNRQSLFFTPSDDDPPRRPSDSLSPWNNFSHQSPGHVSLTLPMISTLDEASGQRQQQHNHQHRSTWSDPFSDPPAIQLPQQHISPLPPRLNPDARDDYYGSTPDFAAFDWDDLPPMSPSRQNQTPNRTRASSIVDLTETSPNVARTSNKRGASVTDSVGRTPKRKREDGSALEGKKAKQGDGKPQAIVEELDLIDVEDDITYAETMKKRQEELMAQQRKEESDKAVKLSTTQCVICLDQPENLVVTHCGHMFCSYCLHGALNIGNKRSCPVCRTAIGAPKKDGKQPKNGVFQLEMKLMTKKQGKKPALR